MAMLREPLDALTTGESSAVSLVIPDASLCTVCQLAAGAQAKVRDKARAEVEAQEQRATKRCVACKVEKPLNEFGSHHRSKDGKRKACKPCVRAGRALCKPLKPEQVVVQKLAASKPARREKNRQAVANWAERHPLAARARQTLMRARRQGAVTPPATCQVVNCEFTSLIAHHPDYGRPLDVLHVCRRHHRLLHGGVALKVKPGVPARLKRLPPTVTLETANAA